MTTYRHIYVIPSDRLVENTVRSYAAEVDYAVSEGLVSKDDVLFTVIHDGNEVLCEKNSTFVEGFFADKLDRPNESIEEDFAAQESIEIIKNLIKTL